MEHLAFSESANRTMTLLRSQGAAIRALEKGKALCYPGAFPKLLSFGTRLDPRALTRKFARKMNH